MPSLAHLVDQRSAWQAEPRGCAMQSTDQRIGSDETSGLLYTDSSSLFHLCRFVRDLAANRGRPGQTDHAGILNPWNPALRRSGLRAIILRRRTACIEMRRCPRGERVLEPAHPRDRRS